MTVPNESVKSHSDIPIKKWSPAHLESLLIALILILAVFSRLYDLGARSMSHDEINQVVPSYSLYKGNGYQYDPVTHGPLQFHMMAFAYLLFGDSDFSSRLPAAVTSIATVAVALLAFRRYLGRIGALAAGVMVLISPYMLFYGRYGRNEAYIVLWGILTIYAMLRYLERGETGILVLFTLVNSIHFTDKATSFIFAAEELIFLGLYFMDRLTRREWQNTRLRKSFFMSLILLIAFFGGAAGLYLVKKPLGVPPQSPNLTVLIEIGVLGVAGLVALFFAGRSVVKDLGRDGLRSERSFDLLILLGTLILPLLAPLPLKLAGLDPLDYSQTGLIRAGIAILPLAVIGILIGWWWKGWRWWLYAFIFYVPILLLYTTFFANMNGLAGGFLGALGYWMSQQGVNRGSQPWYYYALVQIPIYEFLPAIGTILAAIIAFSKRLWQSEPALPFVTGRTEAGEVRRVPTAALVVFWSASSLAAFSWAGERMPWLTIHIALPMILAAGWAIGWLVETVPWGKVRGWTISNYKRATALAFLGVLGLITFRTSFTAAYINYNYPFEYLVYAHGTQDTKAIFNQITELSQRMTGGNDIVVAYDNNVRYPYWWYMREFPNRIDFDVNPTNDIKRAAVIAVSAENYDKIAPIVRKNYIEEDYMRLWWPNEDYKAITWSAIAVERTAKVAADAGPMTIVDYLQYTWKHIQPFFTDPKVRSAVWQIWFNRDYTQWAALKKSDAYTLTNWGVADRMRLYVRKDIASLMWPNGAPAEPVDQAVDPYTAVTVPVSPDRTIGAAGSQAGQFQNPRAIAVAPDGSLYVADSGNNRIQHLSQTGQVLQVWGTFADISKGDAPGGTFNEPWGVAVGPDGNVYVSDTWNYRIQEFTADGRFLSMWGSGPSDTPDGFYGPRGIAVDNQGHVIVADTGNKRILIFDPKGTLLGQVGGPGVQAGQFDEPVDVAVDPSGKLYVTDTWNQRVQVFSPDPTGLNFTPLSQWPVEGWYGQSLDNKPFITVDGKGDIFVTDPEACRVIEFSPEGQALHAWGSCGQAGGWMLPIGLALDSGGGMWVSDSQAGTLVHFKLISTP